MFEDERQFSFLCNPAAWMHSGWRSCLPLWGVPRTLAQVLWQSRYENGALSRFLADRFQLYPTPMLDLEESAQRFLLLDEKKFEFYLTRIGIIFLHPSTLYILDGEALRRLKKEFGDEDFYFLRHDARDFIQVKSSQSFSISRHDALLFGLAAFLKKLPARADILTRLWLKLPPFADEPSAPEGFAQTRLQLDQIGVLHPDAMNKIFSAVAA